MSTPTRFPLGAATVSVLHLGTLRVRLAEWLRLDEADWDALQEALKSPASPVSRALGLADRHGLVEAIEGCDLGDGMRIVPTPGETPGHQAVRVESDGQVLYVLGDLYHHPVEVERPAWGVHWADAAATAKSREALAAAALAEEALLVATHIAGVGRLRRTPADLQWEAAALP